MSAFVHVCILGLGLDTWALTAMIKRILTVRHIYLNTRAQENVVITSKLPAVDTVIVPQYDS